MTDLVFSIEKIFSTDINYGCLGQTDTQKYYIAPYQRGYKWASDSNNSLVSLLIHDLKDAYNSFKISNSKGEYYLQYITVKKNDEMNYLEVIDGQQRLTTLAILFSVLALNDECLNFTNGKLSYAIRKNVSEFLEENIYNSENLKILLTKNWNYEKGLKIGELNYNEQDIYYIFQATRKIDKLLSEVDKLGFYNYIKNNVKIIVNLVEPHINSEKVFRNLNSNKVELTNTELIKALLLTKTARDRGENSHFKELMEIRATMGRQWDEISRWINGEDISSFFFSHKSNDFTMHLLELIALKNGYIRDEKNKDPYKYDLFNFFQSKIKNGEKTAKNFFNDFKLIYAKLNDWYENPEIYNLLGYLFNAKGSKFKRKDILKYFEIDKTILIENLTNEIKTLMPSEISSLSFGDNNDEIHRLLLYLSVFTNYKNIKFDFYKFQNEKWSLEHIFPQNPEKMSNELGEKDITLILSLMDNKRIIDFSRFIKDDITEEEIQKKHEALLIKLNSVKHLIIDDTEKELIYNMIRINELHSIGNMALLTSPDNSSNSNGMFDFKRTNIAKRVSEGSFVPKHTYDVFSKLISKKMTPDLTLWTAIDIKNHAVWIENKLKETTI